MKLWAGPMETRGNGPRTHYIFGADAGPGVHPGIFTIILLTLQNLQYTDLNGKKIGILIPIDMCNLIQIHFKPQ